MHSPGGNTKNLKSVQNVYLSFHTSIFLQRLSDFDDESGDPSQIDLVLKFLQKVRKMFRGFKLKQLKHLANKKNSSNPVFVVVD